MVQPSSSRVLTEDKRVRDLRWFCPPSWTSIDEFNDDTIDAALVRVDASGGTGRAVWEEVGDSLSASNQGGDAAGELHAYMKPLSSFGGALAVGDGVVTCVTMIGPNATDRMMSGLILSDGTTYGSGNQLTARCQAQSDTSLSQIHLAQVFTGFNAAGAAGGSPNYPGQRPYFFRLARIASTSWRMDTSLNGVHWLLGDLVTWSATPTHAGVFSTSWATSTKHVASFDFLRRVTGVT